MIGYLLIAAPFTAIVLWFASLHSTIGDFGALWVGVTGLVALFLWRMRR